MSRPAHRGTRGTEFFCRISTKQTEELLMWILWHFKFREQRFKYRSGTLAVPDLLEKVPDDQMTQGICGLTQRWVVAEEERILDPRHVTRSEAADDGILVYGRKSRGVLAASRTDQGASVAARQNSSKETTDHHMHSVWPLASTAK
jgi:hypothetical protein